MQTETQNYQDIRTQIQHFSNKLLDLSMRNSLLNFKHSDKANNQIQVMNEDLDQVFLNLLAGDEFCLKPVSDTNENEPDLNITIPSVQRKTLQTQLDKNALQKRVRALRRLIKSDFEEKGCNTFYMAFGFLKWCEHESVETPQNTHEAPLLLIKLSLLTDDKKGTFTVSDAGDGVTFNLSLAKKLLEFGIELPSYEDGVTPIQYFHQVQKLMKDKPLWTIEKKLTMGRFIFSRLAMYEDLDIEKNWPHLFELFEQNPALKQLFLSKELPVAAKTYDIDKDTDVETYAPFLVTDADSSQHSAITDVLKGKSLVIKGPPGTGKSQTITNMIANALLQNKKVLFISQKKAALDVVYQRLSKIGLKDFCLELHSDKTSLKNIKSDLANSYDKYCRGNYEIFNDEPVFSSDYDAIKDLKQSKLNIRKYYDALNEKVGAINVSLFDAIWLENECSQALKEVTPAVKNIKIDQALAVSTDEMDEITALLEQLNQSYKNKALKESEKQKFTFKSGNDSAIGNGDN